MTDLLRTKLARFAIVRYGGSIAKGASSCVLIAATADETETVGGTATAGAAQSYSQITKFTVL